MTPTLYGFIPQTYCFDRVRELSPKSDCGDGDPLDICVITERPINRGEVILRARVIGGIQMIDHGEADDKIVAVLDNDQFWKNAKDITDIPPALVERMRHYFETYKLVPGQPSDVHIERIYDREHALKVIRASLEDYTEVYG
jgi:inorganic pyrophosphatase